MAHTDHIELEAKLIVVSDRAEQIFEEIAALPELTDCVLVPLPEQSIRDVYYDSREGKLAGADLALRLRQVNFTSTLGLKGRSQRVAAGIRRLEIEEPWSAEGLDRMLAALAGLGVAFGSAPRFVPSEPETCLRALGLEPIHTRITQRARRAVVRAEQTLGELALDRSLFKLAGQELRHYEIEVESAAREPFAGMGELVQALAALFPGELRAWEYSKLATGRVLEQLLATGSALSLTADDTPDGATYTALEARLRRGGA